MSMFHLRLGLRKLLLFCFLLLGVGLYAQTGTGIPVPTGSGKALYVAPTGGTDALTREQNNINNPWASPHRAWREARPGDVVFYRGGTYTLAHKVCTRELGSVNGTVANPIIHTNYPGEICTFDAINLKETGNLPLGYSHAFSVQRDNYKMIGTKVGSLFGLRIVNFLTGIEVRENSPADNFEVNGVEAVANRAGDNSAFLLAWGGSLGQITLKNSRIIGATPLGKIYGQGAIALSGAYFRCIENNVFENCESGVFQKHPNQINTLPAKMVVAYNYISNCRVGIKWNGNHGHIHNNLIANYTQDGIEMGDNGGVSNTNSIGDYNIIENNTLVGNSGSNAITMIYEGTVIYIGQMHNRIENNIFTGFSPWHQYDIPSVDYDYENYTDFNLYPATQTIINQNRINYTLQGWRNYQLNTHSQVVDAQSLAGTPLFVGGTAPVTIAGFALAAGSPGKNAGSDGKDMGADVTKVGIQALDSLTITSPNGAESWRRNETRAITWTAAGVTENVTIELMQGPTVLGVIATGIAPASGSFTWTVGRLADGTFRTGPNLKIRISTASGRVMAESQWNTP